MFFIMGRSMCHLANVFRWVDMTLQCANILRDLFSWIDTISLSINRKKRFWRLLCIQLLG